MSRPCVPAACSPPIAHITGSCETCGGETVDQICCLKVTRSSWLHPAILKRAGYTIGDPCTTPGANQWCGDLVSTWGSVCIGLVRVEWLVYPDCTISMTITYGDTIIRCNPPSNWHTAPYTVSAPDGDTITIEVCDGSETIFPSADASPVALRAALWFLVDGTWTPIIPGLEETPPNKVYAAATGTSMCGDSQCTDTDTTHIVGILTWSYDIRTDEVTVSARAAGYGHGEVTVAWDSAGAWADGLAVIPVGPEFSVDTPWTDLEWRVARIEDCADPTDPGSTCDSGCYPHCLKCPSAATLAIDIEEDPTCCLHGTFDLYYNSVEDYWQSWPAALEGDPPTTPGLEDRIGGPEGVCGVIEWVIVQCGSDGSHVNVQVRYLDVNGNLFTANYDLAATCTPTFETEYATLASNPFAPGLCDGGLFRGSKLRIVAI